MIKSEALSAIIKHFMSIHDAIAKDVCDGKRYEVRCNDCQSSHKVTTELFSYYLAHGWPVCCNMPMNLINLPMSKGRSSGKGPARLKVGRGTRRK